VGQTTQQLEHHIESTREDLSANLNELERKLKEMADWRYHFHNHPTALMGAAFGGGLLLAAIVGGKRRRHYTSGPLEPTTAVAKKGSETWQNIKNALIGVAATRATDFVEEVLPGFAEQLRKRTG
jgi:hypothetical protein